VRSGIAYGAHTFHSPEEKNKLGMSILNVMGIKTATIDNLEDRSPSLS